MGQISVIISRNPGSVLSANQHQRTGEIIWLLYLACSLRIKIKADALAMCLRMPNALVAILVTHAEVSGLIEGAIDRSFWRSYATKNGLRSTMFLFAYEAALKGWETESAYCGDDEYYGLLHREKLSFFDVEHNSKNLSQVLKERRRENQFSRLRASWDEFTPDPDDESDDFDVDDFEMPPEDPNTY